MTTMQLILMSLAALFGGFTAGLFVMWRSTRAEAERLTGNFYQMQRDAQVERERANLAEARVKTADLIIKSNTETLTALVDGHRRVCEQRDAAEARVAELESRPC